MQPDTPTLPFSQGCLNKLDGFKGSLDAFVSRKRSGKSRFFHLESGLADVKAGEGRMRTKGSEATKTTFISLDNGSR